MDIWDALGMTPQTGLLIAAGGLAFAVVLGAVIRLRADRSAADKVFDLADR